MSPAVSERRQLGPQAFYLANAVSYVAGSSDVGGGKNLDMFARPDIEIRSQRNLRMRGRRELQRRVHAWMEIFAPLRGRDDEHEILQATELPHCVPRGLLECTAGIVSGCPAGRLIYLKPKATVKI
jgi:hypothetical protein